MLQLIGNAIISNWLATYNPLVTDSAAAVTLLWCHWPALVNAAATRLIRRHSPVVWRLPSIDFYRGAYHADANLAMKILSDHPSVRPSVERVHCDKTEKRPVQIFMPHERPFSLVFWEEWLVTGDPFYLKFWVNRPSLERDRRFFTDMRL